MFKREIIDNLSRGIGQPVLRNFQLALRSTDATRLQNTLRQYLLCSASAFDLAKEDFYHGMMLGLLAVMSEDYSIRSNRESGEGRFDIELRPLVKTRPGIIMEFKASDAAEEAILGKLAEEAIAQAKNKLYATELKASGAPSIQIYGIAFAKKKATVKTICLSD